MAAGAEWRDQSFTVGAGERAPLPATRRRAEKTIPTSSSGCTSLRDVPYPTPTRSKNASGQPPLASTTSSISDMMRMVSFRATTILW